MHLPKEIERLRKQVTRLREGLSEPLSRETLCSSITEIEKTADRLDTLCARLDQLTPHRYFED